MSGHPRHFHMFPPNSPELPSCAQRTTEPTRPGPKPGRLLALGLPLALLLQPLGCGDDSGSGGSGGASTNSASSTSSASNATSSGSGGATSASSSTSTTGAGGCDGAALFDGQDDVLLATVGNEVGLGTGFSLGVSVRPDPLPDGGTAFMAGRHLDGSSNGYYLALKNEGGQHKAQFIVFVGGATCTATADVTLPSSGMIHLLGSFDSPNTSIFINGVSASVESCGNFSCFIEPSSVFSVGRSSGGVFPYGGVMGEVAYYGQAFNGSFDPAALGCGNNAQLRYSFDQVAAGRTSLVSEDCGTSADAVVGQGPGPDSQDPTFGCL